MESKSGGHHAVCRALNRDKKLVYMTDQMLSQDGVVNRVKSLISGEGDGEHGEMTLQSRIYCKRQKLINPMSDGFEWRKTHS